MQIAQALLVFEGVLSVCLLGTLVLIARRRWARRDAVREKMHA